MAQAIFAVSIYGANGNDWNNSNGVTMGFSPTQVVLRALPAGTTYSGVTCLSQIQLLPTAPSPIQPVYYSAKTVAEIIAL
jgi:hypothetical protein